MIQAMQILQLPTLDLQARIQQELVENPFLELEEVEATNETEGEAAEPEATAESDGLDQMLDEMERSERDFGDGRARVASSEERDKKYEAMQNAPSLPETLAQALVR